MISAPRIGLALGGGGIAGYAYHAGALGAIHETTGWDPRTAEVIIGTSAGSGIAALIRGGVSVPELVRRVLAIPTNPVDMERLRRASGRGMPIKTSVWSGPSSPLLVLRELTRLHRVRPLNVLVGSLPPGRIETDVLGEYAASLHDDWPVEATWIPAVSLDSGELTVFGRDDRSVDFARAVTASCAIPGFFRPVRIGEGRYVDGGVRSLVNVDLLADLDLDLIVALSPMSISTASARSPFATVLRGYPALQLRRELKVLDRKGTPWIGLEPDRTVARAMGPNPMDPTIVVPSLTSAASAVNTELSRPHHQHVVEILHEAGRLLPSPNDVPFPA